MINKSKIIFFKNILKKIYKFIFIFFRFLWITLNLFKSSSKGI
jgi:hypothetical protein